MAFGTVTAPASADAGGDYISPEADDGGTADSGPDWSVIGTPEAWTAVLRGQVNLSVASRRCDLRYWHYDDPSHPGTPVADVRVDMMAALLGLTVWDQTEQTA